MNNKTQTFIIIILIGLVLVLGGLRLMPGDSSSEFSLAEAEAKSLEFINNVLLAGDSTASITEISEERGLFRVELEIEGYPYTSYITKDLSLFFTEGLDIAEYTQLAQGAEGDSAVVEETVVPEEIGDFLDCLQEAQLVIYGADWCGYTQQVVDLFGGYQAAAPVYVECTQEEDICREAEVVGYPTIKVAGQAYTGERSLAGFAEATGCPRPD